MEERIENLGVKLEFHVWQWLPRNQISDMAVIKWGEGRNFKWLNIARVNCQD